MAFVCPKFYNLYLADLVTCDAWTSVNLDEEDGLAAQLADISSVNVQLVRMLCQNTSLPQYLKL